MVKVKVPISKHPSRCENCIALQIRQPWVFSLSHPTTSTYLNRLEPIESNEQPAPALDEKLG